MRAAKDRAAAALFPRAAKHLQDPDQQLLRISRIRPGPFRGFRCGRARHADRARAVAENDRLAERARRAGHRGRYGRDLFRPAAKRECRQIARSAGEGTAARDRGRVR